MNSKQAKQIPLQDYFTLLGFKPSHSRGNDIWYFSPFHDEKTPSFKLNTQLNTWYDFSIGKGGNIIDFTIEKYNENVSGALRIIGDVCNKVNQLHLTPIKQRPKYIKANNESKVDILEVAPLTNKALIGYITKERQINATIARKYCVEIWFKYKETKYFTIGFKNDSGGYESRNKFFPRSFAPKDITTIKGKSSKLVIIFEGFMDFLSYLTDHKLSELNDTYIILNSVHMKEKAIEKIAQLKPTLLHFYLDNDNSGENAKNDILSKAGIHGVSMNRKYFDYKDYNDYLRGIKRPK